MRRSALLALFIALSSCRDPRAEANIAQAMIDLGTQVSGMQQDYSLLQQQVDSLRGIVARQDTMITRLATLAGVPVQPR